MQEKLSSLPSLNEFAFGYESLGYASFRELFSLLHKDRYALHNDLQASGIEPMDYQVFHSFIGSTPRYPVLHDYPGGLITVALHELLSTYKTTG